MTILVALALYNAVRIKPLNEVKKKQDTQLFDAKAYAADFMANKIESLPALQVDSFLEHLGNNPTAYAQEHGKKLGISDAYHFIIEGKGSVSAIEEEYIVLGLGDGSSVAIATDFIFGNAIRDGSGMAHIDDHQNTMDFNSISVELNNQVRETIVPLLRDKATMGSTLYFKGAVTIAIDQPNPSEIKIIPLRIQIINEP